MSDFKVVLPTTTEEWQRDMNIAYQQGRADKYQEIVSEYMLLTEKQVAEIRADAIGEIATRLEGELTMVMPRDKAKYLMYKVHTVLEQLKEQK